MEASAFSTAQSGDVRELRLAIVLYGGSSLAIYMHGTTKELQRLVKASALAERGVAATTASERVYGEMLAKLAERDPADVRTRVVVDVVAGTSAGGINGVYLAKASPTTGRRTRCATSGSTRRHQGAAARAGWLPAAAEGAAAARGRHQEAGAEGDAIAQWMYGALARWTRPGRSPRTWRR